MRKFVYVTAIFFLLAAFIFSTTRVLAEGSTSQISNIKDCKDNNISVANCPQFLQDKLNSLQGQEKTLSSQITLMNNQIRLTEARIADAEEKIANLEKDIEITKSKVDNLQEDITNSTKALLGRINATYQVGTTNPWEMFLTSGSIENFFTRLKYLRIVQAYDKKTIYAAEQAKADYENQKSIFEDKQAEAEALSSKLQGYTNQLEREQQIKKDLLVVTQNDEKKYKALKDQASRELAALAGSQFSEKKEVKRGDIIGFMGNTGFSSGPHLHFGYYNLTEKEHNEDFKDNIGWYATRNLDPRTALVNRSVLSYDSSCPSPMGNGSFPWPLNNPYVTQCYGKTAWSSVYANGLHDGIDMATNGSEAVVAAEDGIAHFYRGSTSFGNNVRVFHSNGKMSLYLHLQ